MSWIGRAGVLLAAVVALPAAAGERDTSSFSPSIEAGKEEPSWAPTARLQLEQHGRGCLEAGDELVLCWRSAFDLLEDRRLELATDLAIAQAHTADARQDLQRERALAQELADTAARAARAEAQLWRKHAAEVTPTWWDRHRGFFGYGFGVVGTGSAAGGAWVLAQGGDPAMGVGLVIGGLGLDAIGYLLAIPP